MLCFRSTRNALDQKFKKVNIIKAEVTYIPELVKVPKNNLL